MESQLATDFPLLIVQVNFIYWGGYGKQKRRQYKSSQPHQEDLTPWKKCTDTDMFI